MLKYAHKQFDLMLLVISGPKLRHASTNGALPVAYGSILTDAVLVMNGPCNCMQGGLEAPSEALATLP